MIEQSIKKRKRNLDPAATRSKILEASVRLFSRHGYHSVSFAQIAEEVGLPKSLVAYHFGSKEELWAAVAEHVLRPGIAMMDRFLGGGIEVGDLLRARLTLFSQTPTPSRFIGWASLTNVPLPEFLVDRREQLQAQVGAVDPEAVVRCLIALALMDGWYLNRETYAMLLGEDAVKQVTDERIREEIEKLIPKTSEVQGP